MHQAMLRVSGVLLMLVARGGVVTLQPLVQGWRLSLPYASVRAAKAEGRRSQVLYEVRR